MGRKKKKVPNESSKAEPKITVTINEEVVMDLKEKHNIVEEAIEKVIKDVTEKEQVSEENVEVVITKDITLIDEKIGLTEEGVTLHPTNFPEKPKAVIKPTSLVDRRRKLRLGI